MDPTKYFLSYTELKEFIEETRGKKTITDVIAKYTKDPEHITELIKSIYNLTNDAATKRGFNNLITKIENQTKSTPQPHQK